MTGFRILGVAVLGALLATGAQAAPCNVTFGASFAGSYSCNDLGTPSGVAGPLGGLTFLNNNTLLIGGGANGGGGIIRTIGVQRDGAGHITGFNGVSSAYATAAFIDGGLSFASNGTLVATGYPNNTLLQYLPGSASPDLVTSLSSLGVASSVGALAFVPAGFAGAGSLKLASYSAGGFYDLAYTIGAGGLLSFTGATFTAQIGRGPEGIVYVAGANAGFGTDSVLTADYGFGTVSAYDSDAGGNPIAGSRRDFISGLSGAEGAAIDPLTGDFLFSTFGGSDRVLVIGGFTAPVPGVPEPATWAMMLSGFGAIGGAMRLRKVAARLA